MLFLFLLDDHRTCLFSVNVVNGTIFTVIYYFYIFGLLVFCLGFLLHICWWVMWVFCNVFVRPWYQGYACLIKHLKNICSFSGSLEEVKTEGPRRLPSCGSCLQMDLALDALVPVVYDCCRSRASTLVLGQCSADTSSLGIQILFVFSGLPYFLLFKNAYLFNSFGLNFLYVLWNNLIS